MGMGFAQEPGASPTGAPPSSFRSDCPGTPRRRRPALQPAGRLSEGRVSGTRARWVAFVPGAGARRALGLFPRHFPVTFQRRGQFRGGPCPRPVHKGPTQEAATTRSQPRRQPFRATMRGAHRCLLLRESSGLRGAGRRLAGRGQAGQGQAKPTHLCPPEGSQGCGALLLPIWRPRGETEARGHIKGVAKPAW